MQETTTSLEAIGAWISLLEVQQVVFLIDAVVSNSGRLAGHIRALAGVHGWPWNAFLVPSADPVLQRTTDIVATSDSSILDKATRWFDLAAAVVHHLTPDAWCVNLDVPPPVID
jgi:hypothetical protein